MRIAKYCCCLSLALAINFSYAQKPQEAVPAPISYALDSLLKINSLAEWIYARIDYSYASPDKSLHFLMATEKQMWRPARSKEEKEAMLILYSNQAYNHLFSGNILESIACYEKAYNYYTAHKLNVGGIEDYLLKPWANNYTRLGDYEKALFIQKQTLAYALKVKNQELIAGTYNNIAISLRSLGNLKEAEKSVKKGIKFLLPGSRSVALLNNTLADIYKDGGQTGLAESIITKNIVFQKQRELSFESAYWLLSSYISAGDIQLGKRNYAAAKSDYLEASQINDRYYKGARRREKAYLTTQLGTIKLQSGKPADAIQYYNQTLSILGFKVLSSLNEEVLFGDNRLIDVLYQRSLAYLELGDSIAALRNIQLSLAAADKIRFELADVKTRQRFQADTKRKAEMAIEIAFGLLAQTKQHRYAATILALFEQTKARTLIDDIRKNDQQLNLKIKDPLFDTRKNWERAIAFNEREMLLNPANASATKQKIEVLKFKLQGIQKKLSVMYPAQSPMTKDRQSAIEILQALPARAHIVAYFVGRQCIYALEIKNKRIVHVKRILQAPRIKSMVTDFVNVYYRNGPEAMMADPKSFFAKSYKIYAKLLGNLDIKRNEKIVIIPDETLGYLSFDGLLTDSSYLPAISRWPYLIRKINLSYGFSLQTLIDQSRRKTWSTESFTGLFISHEKESGQPIPAVKKEAEAIKDLLAGEYIMDQQAVRENFNQAFAKTAVLHISTHATLSGPEKAPTLALADGAVFLFELSASRNVPALVVLSACQTADGLMADGEGILSMSRGFTSLGTQGTISGLWNVNDDAAATITAGCYKGMLDGKEISTALRLSKLSWLNGKRNAEQEFLPYYWDALIYMGHDQSLKLTAYKSKTVDYAFYLAIAAALGGFFLLILHRRKRKKMC